jgi:hypothetical protein
MTLTKKPSVSLDPLSLAVKEWKAFKVASGNTSRLQIDELRTTIVKRFSVATPPVRVPSILRTYRKFWAYTSRGYRSQEWACLA